MWSLEMAEAEARARVDSEGEGAGAMVVALAGEAATAPARLARVLEAAMALVTAEEGAKALVALG